MLLPAIAIILQLTDGMLQCQNFQVNKNKFALPPKQNCINALTIKGSSIAPLFMMQGKTRDIWSSVLIGTGAVGISITISLR